MMLCHASQLLPHRLPVRAHRRPRRPSALALLIFAVAIGNLGAARLLVAAGWLFCAGVVLFSGNLYALALTGTTALGAITPIGGVLLIGGWACLAVFALLR